MHIHICSETEKPSLKFVFEIMFATSSKIVKMLQFHVAHDAGGYGVAW